MIGSAGDVPLGTTCPPPTPRCHEDRRVTGAAFEQPTRRAGITAEYREKLQRGVSV
ncbi:MAG TPA: hypothetical protein VMU77_00885 [Acidimicrobiales bacterium]|nr:hypothetical protein [Acidimicrobiales bacterium]